MEVQAAVRSSVVIEDGERPLASGGRLSYSPSVERVDG